MIRIDEVAKRNGITLYHPRSSRPGQLLGHCPYCGDTGRNYHLAVNTDRDIFRCWKCGENGGAVKFHAWLRGISFEEARAELYPEQEGTQKRRPRHPAESLTREQVEEMGFVYLRLPYNPPNGITPNDWSQYRRRTLDYLWLEWLKYKAFQEAQHKRLFAAVAEGMKKQSSESGRTA